MGAALGLLASTPKDANQKVTFEFLDAAGKAIAAFTSDQDAETAADSLRTEAMKQKLARIGSIASMTFFFIEAIRI